jgi:hypothetical protein
MPNVLAAGTDISTNGPTMIDAATVSKQSQSSERDENHPLGMPGP